MTKVLILSYHYPPCAYGCIIRVINFVKYLPEFGFQPVILTVKPEYYKEFSEKDDSYLPGMPADIQVFRTGSLEPVGKIGPGLLHDTPTKRGLLSGIKRWGMGLVQKAGYSLLVPDVQILWSPAAVKAGRRILAEQDIPLIFAVAPYFSALAAAYWLKKFTGRKLVLDFKDMWVGRDQHEHRTRLCSLLSKPMEKAIVGAADRVISTTGYSHREFVKRYPEQASKFFMLPNGYDPQIEDLLKNAPSPSAAEGGTPLFKIAHSGTVDTDRNPSAFIYAVKELCAEQPEFARRVRIYFAGKVHHNYINLVNELSLNGVFEFIGYLSYHDNILLLNSAYLLLLLTTHGAPDAIPGKLYEYLAINKPILAVTEDGASKDLLDSLGTGKTIHPGDMVKAKAEIKQALWSLYQDFCQQKLAVSSIPVENFNRRNQARQLAQVFSELLR